MLTSKMMRMAPTYVHHARSTSLRSSTSSTAGARAWVAPRGASTLAVGAFLAVQAAKAFLRFSTPTRYGESISSCPLAQIQGLSAQVEPWGKPADGDTFCADYGMDSQGRCFHSHACLSLPVYSMSRSPCKTSSCGGR
jgi:hypothetical protein